MKIVLHCWRKLWNLPLSKSSLICLHKIFNLRISFFQIVVPTLHLGLGIYKNLYEKLEAECHGIDVLMYKGLVNAGEIANEDDATSTNFNQTVNSKITANQHIDADIVKMEEELHLVEEELPLRLLQQSKEAATELTKPILDLIDRQNSIKDKIQSMVKDPS